jgi:hypothetical protein
MYVVLLAFLSPTEKDFGIHSEAVAGCSPM